MPAIHLQQTGWVSVILCLSVVPVSCVRAEPGGTSISREQISWEKEGLQWDAKGEMEVARLAFYPMMSQVVTCITRASETRRILVGTRDGILVLNEDARCVAHMGKCENVHRSRGSIGASQNEDEAQVRLKAHSSILDILQVAPNTYWAKAEYGLWVLDGNGDVIKNYVSDREAIEKEHQFIASTPSAWQVYPYDGQKSYLSYGHIRAIGGYDGSAWEFREFVGGHKVEALGRRTPLQCGSRVLLTTQGPAIDCATEKPVAGIPARNTWQALDPVDNGFCLLFGESVWLVNDAKLTSLRGELRFERWNLGTHGLLSESHLYYGTPKYVADISLNEGVRCVRMISLPEGYTFFRFNAIGKRVFLAGSPAVLELAEGKVKEVFVLPPPPSPAQKIEADATVMATCLATSMIVLRHEELLVGTSHGLFRHNLKTGQSKWLRAEGP